MSNDEQSKLDAYAEDLQGRWTAVDEDPDDTDEDDVEWLRQPVESNQDFAPFLDAGHPFADRLWALPEDVQEQVGAARPVPELVDPRLDQEVLHVLDRAGGPGRRTAR